MSNNYLDLHRQLLNANLAKNLVLARNATDLTQSDLAKIANISRATIAQIESGEGDPRLSTIIDISTSLGISPVLLLIGEDEINALINLIKEYDDKKISDKDKERMEFLLSTGIKKNKIKAAKIGIAATAGLSSVGAAIGSVLLPGIGTLVGATFGALASKNYKGKDAENEK